MLNQIWMLHELLSLWFKCFF